MQRLEILRQTFEMLRLGGKLQLARAAEVAIDAFLRDQALQRIDGGIERPVEGDRAFLAKLGLGGEIGMGETIVEMPAIAAGGAQPTRSPSRTTTRAPALASWRAAPRPVKPPPMTATS